MCQWSLRPKTTFKIMLSPPHIFGIYSFLIISTSSWNDIISSLLYIKYTLTYFPSSPWSYIAHSIYGVYLLCNFKDKTSPLYQSNKPNRTHFLLEKVLLWFENENVNTHSCDDNLISEFNSETDRKGTKHCDGPSPGGTNTWATLAFCTGVVLSMWDSPSRAIHS